MSNPEEWAQLVSTTDHTSEPVTIKKKKFILGRARNSDLVFEGNKLVSGCHCTIEKDGDGKVWLQDTSTNGTLVNLTKKVHKMKIEIHHGDEIHLVYRKMDPCSNIAYLFQDLAALVAEEVDTTLEYSSEPDVVDEKEGHVPISVLVRRRTFEGATSDDEPEPKRPRTDCTPPQTGSFGRQGSGEPGNMDATQPPPMSSGGDATQPPPSEEETQAPPGISGGDATQPPPSDETQAPPGISGGDATQSPPSDETQAPPGISGGDATQPPPADETQAPPTTMDIEQTLPPPLALEAQNVKPRKSQRKVMVTKDATQLISAAAMETQDATQAVTSDMNTLPGTSTATTLAADPEEVKGPRTRRAKLRRITSLQKDDKSTKQNTPPSQGEKEASEETKPEDKKEASASKEKEKAEETVDPYEETLVCIICQEIMHNVISLQPCMHSFCAGCYSGWMKRSNECPSCRGKVERINKNHLVNNLVDVYLSQHPEKKRTDEDIADLEAKNTIKIDMPFPEDRGSFDPDSQSGPFDDDDDDEMEEESSDYGSTDEDENDGGTVIDPYDNSGGPGTIYYKPPIRPPPTLCRQCPGYAGAPRPFGAAFTAVGNIVNNVVNLFKGTPNTAAQTVTAATPTPGTAATATPAATPTPGTAVAATAKPAATPTPGTAAAATATPATDGEQPGTSGGVTRTSQPDIKVMPTALAYVCRPGQTHIMCACCLQPMPDRRAEYALRPDTERPQQCRLCYRMFCHAYWGCNQANCLGCLGKFSELNFGKQCLPALIMENHFESQILEQYLTAKGMSVKDLLLECCAKLETGEYKCPTLIALARDTIVCYTCGLRQFRELAYQYRKDIPDDQVPDAAKGRPDCYWGKNCRTQKGKLQHSIRFNHICEQTRKS